MKNRLYGQFAHLFVVLIFMLSFMGHQEARATMLGQDDPFVIEQIDLIPEPDIPAQPQPAPPQSLPHPASTQGQKKGEAADRKNGGKKERQNQKEPKQETKLVEEIEQEKTEMEETEQVEEGETVSEKEELTISENSVSQNSFHYPDYSAPIKTVTNEKEYDIRKEEAEKQTMQQEKQLDTQQEAQQEIQQEILPKTPPRTYWIPFLVVASTLLVGAVARLVGVCYD